MIPPRPCDSKIDECICTDDPFQNLSAEAPDPFNYLRMSYRLNDPPLNSPNEYYTVLVGTGGGSGPTPQDADDAAAIDANHTMWDRWGNPPRTPIMALYGNQEQSCVFCGEGFEPFIYTVPLGTVIAHSQAEANAIAASLCQQRGLREVECVPVIPEPPAPPSMDPPKQWWTMEEACPGAGACQQLDVISGSPLTISGSGTLIQAAGKINFGVQMNALAPSPTINLAGNTFSFQGKIDLTGWFKIVSIGAAGTVDFRPFAVTFGGGKNLRLQYIEFPAPAYRLTVFNDQPSIPFTAVDNQWHFLRCFVDVPNLLVGLQIDGGAITSLPLTTTLTTGAKAFSSGIFNFDQGGIVVCDEIALWDRILTPAEIAILYNNGDGRSWPFTS